MTAGRCSRTVRAAVFATVCVLLAALGHVLMSGNHVAAWAMAAGLAGTGAVGWSLAGRERGLPLVVTVVVAVQAVLHSAFSLAQSAGEGLSSTGAGTGAGAGTSAGAGAVEHHMGSTHMHSLHMNMEMGMGGVHTHSAHSMETMDAMDMGHMGGSHISSSMGGSSSFGMLAAHLLAALLCGLWLAYGERAAFRVLRALAGWLAAPLRLLLALPVPPDRPRVRARRGSSVRVPGLLLVYAITSRGPPAGTAVA